MNGKGRGPEKGYNRQAYAANYDAIFRRKGTQQNTQPMKTPEQEQQPTVLPWHREAAKDCCNFGDHWNKGPGATLPNGSYGDNMAAIIARHDPHQETLRLLEEMVADAKNWIREANRGGAEFNWDAETYKVRAHIAKQGGAK